MNKTLNRESILAMQPERELDSLIAEKVMGWRYKETVYSWGEVLSPAQWIKPNGWPVDRVPNYSTDISAAWGVVEELEQKKWFVTIRNRSASFHLINNGKILDGTGIVTANSTPESICKAALLAVLDE